MWSSRKLSFYLLFLIRKVTWWSGGKTFLSALPLHFQSNVGIQSAVLNWLAWSSEVLQCKGLVTFVHLRKRCYSWVSLPHLLSTRQIQPFGILSLKLWVWLKLQPNLGFLTLTFCITDLSLISHWYRRWLTYNLGSASQYIYRISCHLRLTRIYSSGAEL